jgi:hypothetical protein
MSNILPILALISAGLYGLTMFSKPSDSYKGGRRKTRKNRRK